MSEEKCGALLELENGKVLVCTQTEHPFPTHSDGHHQWGDIALIAQQVPDELVEGDGGVEDDSES